MKVLVFLAALFVYAQAQVAIDKNELEKHVQTCIEEKNLNKEEIMTHFKTNTVPEDNSELTGFVSCYCKKIGIVNEDGTMNNAGLENMLPQMLREYPKIEDADKAAVDVLEHCKNIQSQSPGLTCIKYRNCLMERIKDKI